MNYYCSACDETIYLNKKSHFKSLTHYQYEKSIRKNHTIKNPNFFDIGKMFNVYITNHNKKFDLYLFKCEFKTRLY